jgi:hypothetical protein
MIFCEFSSIFSTLETQKPTVSIFGKTGPVYQKNRSINQNSGRFTDRIKKITNSKFLPVLLVFAKPVRAGFTPHVEFSIPGRDPVAHVYPTWF